MTTEQLEEMSNDDLRDKHKKNAEILPTLVGHLYSSIFTAENEKIRSILMNRGEHPHERRRL